MLSGEPMKPLLKLTGAIQTYLKKHETLHDLFVDDVPGMELPGLFGAVKRLKYSSMKNLSHVLGRHHEEYRATKRRRVEEEEQYDRRQQESRALAVGLDTLISSGQAPRLPEDQVAEDLSGMELEADPGVPEAYEAEATASDLEFIDDDDDDEEVDMQPEAEDLLRDNGLLDTDGTIPPDLIGTGLGGSIRVKDVQDYIRHHC